MCKYGNSIRTSIEREKSRYYRNNNSNRKTDRQHCAMLLFVLFLSCSFILSPFIALSFVIYYIFFPCHVLFLLVQFLKFFIAKFNASGRENKRETKYHCPTNRPSNMKFRNEEEYKKKKSWDMGQFEIARLRSFAHSSNVYAMWKCDVASYFFFVVF